MLILIAALVIVAVAFGIGAAVHFLWLGLIIVALLALIGLVARAL